MTGRQAVIALTLGMFATAAAADNAVRRDSSSSGGSHDSGARQPSVHSSGSSGSGHSSPPPSHGGPSGGTTAAERRQPRPGTGTGHGGYYHPGYGHGHGYGYGYYYPYYYPYGYGAYWWPYGSFGFYGGYYGGYYPYGGVYHYAYDDRGSLRILVDQEKARVYVDGYYAGVVDDYDGLFQRLYVAPGRHDIAFKLEGYVTHRVKIYVGAGATLKIHHDMVKGAGPDTAEDLAGDVDDRYARRGDERYDARDRNPDDDAPVDDRPALRVDPAPRAEPAPRDEPARLRLSVLPEDASIYLDGQFKGSARQMGSFPLPPGRHRVEVVRPGFRTEERDLDLEPGRTRELDIELQRP